MGKEADTKDSYVVDGEYSISSIDEKREVLAAARATELLQPLICAGENDVLVRRVSLSGKSFAPDAARVARDALKGVAKTLKELDMADVIAGQPEAAAKETLGEICTAFAETKGLQWLDVSDNAFGRKGVVCLEPLLSGQKDLKHIYFCNNGLAADAASLLVDFLKDAKKLETLHFHNNLLESAGAEVLAKLIGKLSSIRSFRFSTTRGTSSGIKALSASLMNSAKSLSGLEFTDNTITLEGADAIAELVRKTSVLTSLRLRDCSLDDRGVTTILEAFEELDDSPLQELDISGNDLTEDGSSEIAECLSHIRSLERIWLEDNELGDGALCIVQALNSSSLKHIDLSCCEIGSQTGWKIAMALKGREVAKVGLNGNMLSGSLIDKIKTIFGNKLGAMSDNDSDGEEVGMGDEGGKEGERTISNDVREAEDDKAIDSLANKLGEKLNV